MTQRFLGYKEPIFAAMKISIPYWDSPPSSSGQDSYEPGTEMSASPASTPLRGHPCRTLDELLGQIRDPSAPYKPALERLAIDTASIVCDRRLLHVFETDTKLDNLIHLTFLIDNLDKHKKYIPRPGKPGSDVSDIGVIVVEGNGQLNFSRVCALVTHLLREEGTKHAQGQVMEYSCVWVVRGFNYDHSVSNDGGYSQSGTEEARNATRLISSTIDRAFATGQGKMKDKLVWHHGPVVHFLNYFIAKTTDKIRNALSAVTVMSPVTLNSQSLSIRSNARRNRVAHLETLATYLNRLGIFAVFLDHNAQLLAHSAPNAYLPRWGLHHRALLPPSLYLDHLSHGLDTLVRHAFQLYAHTNRVYGNNIITIIKSQLNPKTAKAYVRTCMNPDSYTEKACRKALSDREMVQSYYLADAPLLPHPTGISALARLWVGPGSEAYGGTLGLDRKPNPYVGIPIEYTLTTEPMTVHIAAPSPFRLWICPAEGDGVNEATVRTQTAWITTVERLRWRNQGQDTGGTQLIWERVKASWAEVAKVVEKALERVAGKTGDEGVEARVKAIRELIGGAGHWAWSMKQEDGERSFFKVV